MSRGTATIGRALAGLWLAAALLAGGCSGLQGPAPDPGLRPGKGLVFLYRGSDARSSQARFLVTEDELVIGALESGTYFYRYAEPGRHYYAVKPVGPDTADHEAGTFLDVSPGERHYLEAFAEEGGPPIRAQLFVKYSGQAQPALEQLRVVQPGHAEATR